MINIFCKKAFRFPNPDPRLGLVSKPKKNESPEQASARLAQDSSKLGNRDKHAQLFFDTKPGEIQQAPDWIREDEMFNWAVQDGDLMVIETKAPAKQEAEVAKKNAEAEKQAEEGTGRGSCRRRRDRNPSRNFHRSFRQRRGARPLPVGARRRKITGS
jgi:hypothetical protein